MTELSGWAKAPMPYFGGKRHAASAVWEALGDVSHYVEPFAGSLAVLLNRPHEANRPYFSESVNDADGLLVNVWRAIQLDPEATAFHASNPVAECVPAGTLIATPSGDVPVESVTGGMVVWGFDGEHRVRTTVLATKVAVTDECLVQLDLLSLTGNHPVWTNEQGYIPASRLRGGMHVVRLDTKGLRTVRITVPPTTQAIGDPMGGAEFLFSGLSESGAPNDGRSELPHLPERVSPVECQAESVFGSLLRNDSAQRTEHLRNLSEAVLCPSRGQDATLLLTSLWAEVRMGSQPRDDGIQPGDCQISAGGESRGASQASRMAAFPGESNLRSGGTEQCSPDPARSWIPEPELSRWSHRTAAALVGAVGVGDGVQDYSGGWQSTVLLSSRSGGTGCTDQCGGGWKFSSRESDPGAGRTQGCSTPCDGVADLTLYQPADYECARSDRDGDPDGCVVYNFQTTTGNYFANGILVHNCDLHARHSALVRWRNERQLEHLMGDPDFHDAKMAGWWLWGIACWIGGSWCAGDGAWVPDADGRLVKQERGQSREPGVSRQLPHLGADGQGVNHAGLREPGVSRQRPFLIDNGQGVNHAGLREPGVSRKRPHLGNDGQGVNSTTLREPGVDFHEVTMPKLLEWFAYLSARLRHVRILNGDWSRLVTSGASKTLMVRGGKGVCGVFLDPPYSGAADRDNHLYANDSGRVAHEVRAWCLAHGDDPDYRIVLAGFAGEGHEVLEAAGWRAVEWFTPGYLRGGMGQQGADGHQQDRERLWLSQHCLTAALPPAQLGLFA